MAAALFSFRRPFLPAVFWLFLAYFFLAEGVAPCVQAAPPPPAASLPIVVDGVASVLSERQVELIWTPTTRWDRKVFPRPPSGATANGASSTRRSPESDISNAYGRLNGASPLEPIVERRCKEPHPRRETRARE